jgi:hypothetical protein
MNLNINSTYTFQQTPPVPVSVEKKETAKELTENKIIPDNLIPDITGKEDNKIITQEAVMMDFDEVKNFLFMLIGAEVQVQDENSAKSGSLVDRLA